MRQWLKDNSLSVIFFSLFLITLAAESFSGLLSYNALLTAHGLPPLSYFQYLHTGTFLDGIFENWQAAVLQLACLVIFSATFHQKGASHSRKPEGSSLPKEQDGANRPWVYRNSLFLAFAFLFAVSFIAHSVFGDMAYNEARAIFGGKPIPVAEYVLTSDFWVTNTQTWEAEFAVIGLFIVFSIFLRQQGSPESKPVNETNEATGETNK